MATSLAAKLCTSHRPACYRRGERSEQCRTASVFIHCNFSLCRCSTGCLLFSLTSTAYLGTASYHWSSAAKPATAGRNLIVLTQPQHAAIGRTTCASTGALQISTDSPTEIYPMVNIKHSSGVVYSPPTTLERPRAGAGASRRHRFCVCWWSAIIFSRTCLKQYLCNDRGDAFSCCCWFDCMAHYSKAVHFENWEKAEADGQRPVVYLATSNHEMMERDVNGAETFKKTGGTTYAV
eukprot:SAG31_NODE_314_length_17854_cov_3.932075_7_plen_236_part_00